MKAHLKAGPCLKFAPPPKPDGHTRIVLVRHGETPWNQEKRFQGHTDIALNAKGIEQAHRLGLALAQMAHMVPESAISSDLGRAQHTANILLEYAPGLSLFTDPMLRERHYGHLAGLTGDEMQQKSPSEYTALTTRQPNSTIQGGESLSAFYTRVTQAFLTLLEKQRGQTVLVVSHGGVLDCIYRLCTNTPLQAPRQWLVPNCAINVIDFDLKGKNEILTWANLQHLSVEAHAQQMDEVDGRIA